MPLTWWVGPGVDSGRGLWELTEHRPGSGWEPGQDGVNGRGGGAKAGPAKPLFTRRARSFTHTGLAVRTAHCANVLLNEPATPHKSPAGPSFCLACSDPNQAALRAKALSICNEMKPGQRAHLKLAMSSFSGKRKATGARVCVSVFPREFFFLALSRINEERGERDTVRSRLMKLSALVRLQPAPERVMSCCLMKEENNTSATINSRLSLPPRPTSVHSNVISCSIIRAGTTNVIPELSHPVPPGKPVLFYPAVETKQKNMSERRAK